MKTSTVRHLPGFTARVLGTFRLVLAPAIAGAAGERPTLRALSIGVSRYRDADLDLRFADSDARAIAAELQRQATGKVCAAVQAQVLPMPR